MDQMVLKTQQWLNENYTEKTGFTPIPENGNTGWTTIYGLLHAFQIELGITSTADNFGPGTENAFNRRFPNGINKQADNALEEDNIYGIIQGTLWCKGYSTGANAITKHFFAGTAGAIESLKSDAGLLNPTSIADLNVMKALMSMNQYVKVSSGSVRIRVVQQRLNREYLSYIGLSPCDGIYSRKMNNSLIIALQAIEKYSPQDATGNFGSGTKSKLPLLPDIQEKLTIDEKNKAIDLVKYCLICNGYSSGVEFANYNWDSTLINVVKTFQKDLKLAETGNADVDTWMSLMLSKGNPERPCVASDTRFEITSDKIMYLKQNGYEIVGRYIVGGNFKEIRDGELQRIIDSGLKYFPIYQKNGSSNADFTLAEAKNDALQASKAVRKHGIPEESIVYFAVDYDTLDSDIKNYIIPYFSEIVKNFDSLYNVGIYATRNACSQVLASSGALTAFVSDMSTGFSGNMGFKMPTNWNFDQFFEFSTKRPNEISLPYPNGWDLDRVAYSNKYPAISTIDKRYQKPIKFSNVGKQTITFFNSLIEIMEKYAVKYILEVKKETINNSSKVTLLVLDFLRYWKYNDTQWKLTLREIDLNFMEYFTQNYQKETGYNFVMTYGDYLQSNSIEYLLSDGSNGIIDLPHLAATIEGYLITLFPKFWTGWGGDLATAIGKVNSIIISDPSKNIQDVANNIIGSGEVLNSQFISPFNYSDICCDSDSIKIAELIKQTNNFEKPLSSSISMYYSQYIVNRYLYYLDDIIYLYKNLPNISGGIKNSMINILHQAINIITLKGGNPYPSAEVINECCRAFANYILSEL
ncbi:MAG: DUF1906 domain-containing protein [Clostridia bacterium]